MLFNLNPRNAPRRRRQPRRPGLPVRVTSQDEAAATVGVAVRYVTAAVAVLKTEDPELLDAVLTGRMPLPVAVAPSAAT